MADGGCSTTSTTTVTAIRTTSTVEENDVDEESRQQQRAQQQRPQRGDQLRRDRAETGEKFDRRLISSELQRRLQQNGPLSSIFRFLLVVFSKFFLASPQGTKNFCDTGSNPSSETFFSPQVAQKLFFFSLDLVRSFERETD